VSTPAHRHMLIILASTSTWNTNGTGQLYDRADVPIVEKDEAPGVCTIPLSTRTLTRLADLLRAHRRAIGSRWRRLEPDRQALLVLAHLRNGDTRDRLAAVAPT
jgi:hypothetical protein